MPVSDFQLGKAITQWIKNQVNTDQGQQQAFQRINRRKSRSGSSHLLCQPFIFLHKTLNPAGYSDFFGCKDTLAYSTPAPMC
jgi:hypothetical protein